MYGFIYYCMLDSHLTLYVTLIQCLLYGIHYEHIQHTPPSPYYPLPQYWSFKYKYILNVAKRVLYHRTNLSDHLK